MLMHSEDQNQHTSFLSLISPRDVRVSTRAVRGGRAARADGFRDAQRRLFFSFLLFFLLTRAETRGRALTDTDTH